MSDWDEKTEAPKPADGNLARRPWKSFIKTSTYGFRVEEEIAGRPMLISYCEADERTFWQRVAGLDGDWWEIIPERTEKGRRN